MTSGFEAIALVIGAATVLGIIAQKTGQPKVIAYIIAGLLIGPVGLSLVTEGELLSLFSELGLVFLLFLIGLEINLDEVKTVLGSTIGIAIVQMFLTFLVGLGLVLLLSSTFPVKTALFGLAFAFSLKFPARI